MTKRNFVGGAPKREATIARFARAEGGNIVLLAALLMVPLFLAVGLGVDYARLVKARSEVQNVVDGATLAGAKVLSASTDAQIASAVQTYAAKAFDLGWGALKIDGVAVDRSNLKVTTTATLSVPTTFGALAGLDSFSAAVSSAAVAPNRPYMTVYLLLDNSASMGLAATTDGQTTMTKKIGCVFACHTDEGATYKVNGVTYHTTYDASVALGVTLRHDVMNTAAKKVISMIDAVDPNHERIKVGVYYFNQDVSTAQSPTYTTSKATAALSGTYSNLGVDGTYFDTSLTSMRSIVGVAGDGSSASSPLKLVLMVSDGVQSLRSWVLSGSSTWPKVAPNKPNNCTPIKANGATFGVLYTEYLAITGDWGYEATVGSTMPASWGVLDSGASASITRRDYLPYALKDCASSGYYMSANSTSDIESGLTTLFDKWIEHLRLAR
ncbi:MAG: pilus assembly protein [Hyphomicrobiales bacterium]|nr:pilus assembly protein [Hyphomicrobiales bacterium]